MGLLGRETDTKLLCAVEQTKKVSFVVEFGAYVDTSTYEYDIRE